MSLLRTTCCVLGEKGRSSARLTTVVAVAALCAVSACTDVGTSPTTPVSLAFDTLPSPSVVFGDTLRDINGVATKLTGHAYNSDGREIPNADIEYFSSDTKAAHVTADDYLIAGTDTAKKTLTLKAQVDRIPSALARTVEVTWRPDSVDRGATAIDKEDTLYYAAGDTGVKLLQSSLSVRVLSRYVPDTTKTDTLTRFVKSWLVRYRVLSPVGADSTQADSLVTNDNGVRASIDTTDGSGVAARKIRIRLAAGHTMPESVVVEARVRYKGVDVRGAPIRFVVRIRQSS